MRRRYLPIMMILVAAAAALVWGANPCIAGPGGGTYYANSPASGVTGTAIRKFVDSLPGLTSAGKNNLGQYIPLAIPDTTTFNGSDYYEIGLREYTERLHSDLPKATRLRGYYQINTTDPTVNVNQYLGPLILATKNRPVRVKFINNLPTGTAGNLFIPVDTSLMGAGTSPASPAGTDCNAVPKPATCYTENRATLHLHGGNSPWISDGTPYQWTVPVGETTTLKKGVSTVDVPDMPATANGQMTFYWTNQQSGRLMFYHDHALGITRLNVYAGEAAGYLLRDPVEEDALRAAGVPGTLGANSANWDLPHLIPLVIQDKTFVPQNIATQDSKWDMTKWGQPGDLWFPHVYEANQDPYSPSGANPFGRWDYGPWFWPPVVVDAAHATLPEPTTTPEAFGDTMLVNGTAYPYVTVQPQVYRFQILNASNDRSLNLQLYYADPADPTGKDVKMVPASPNPSYPVDWPTDGRQGGVPDPATVGPNMIQIGTEGGVLPNPVVIPNRPIGFDYNRRNIVVLNTLFRALFLGPAERADVIVDFSQVPPGSKLILYNDAPTPNPAFDTRYDYYTGNPDQTTSGGAPSTIYGYGPNTRTIMQIQVAGTPSAPFNLATLQAALPAIFKASTPAPVVPEQVYNNAFPTEKVTTDLYAKISDFSMSYKPYGTTVPTKIEFRTKAIQELWDPYGRMNATLGVELPFTNSITQTTIPLGYAEPPTETVTDGQPQIWKITHNGVDTHPVHFHLFNVQVLNRVGWDGAIRPPDENELGWKETVRMSPLEDVILAVLPLSQTLPFALPTSSRYLDPSQPAGAPMPTTNMTVSPPVATTIPNAIIDYGFEYVWHCHILGHEENDFMRPMIFRVPSTVPAAATGLTAILGGQIASGITNNFTNEVILTWTDNASNLASFRIERAPVSGGGSIGAYAALGTTQFQATSTPSFTDTTVNSNSRYAYRVFAYNALGDSIQSNIVQVTTPTWAKASSLTVTSSAPSPHIQGTSVIFTAVATGPTSSMRYNYRFSLASGATSTVVQNYSTQNLWSMLDTTPTGTYVVTVDVLSSGPGTGTPPAPDRTTSVNYVIVVPAVPIGSFSPLPGTYSQAVSGPSVTVTLSSNVAANIFYTMNGAIPTTLSTRYTTPLGLTASTTIKFIAVDANGSSSVVNTATYLIHVPDLTATVLINNGLVSTNTTSVVLTLAASDPTGVASMQFSNDNITYSAEEPYATTKNWDLAFGLATLVTDGTRTVYARFRDNSLPTPGTLYPPVIDTIVMDRVAPVTTALPAAGLYAAASAPILVNLVSNEPATTYYTVDGSTPTKFSNVYLTPILVSTLTTTIKYFSVDLAGNAEPVNTGIWQFDTGNDITASILINGGLVSTGTPTVTLSLLATDPTGTIVQMQFSNDSVIWSGPEVYATTKAWVLSPGDGIKTVYARFQDNLTVWSSPFTATIVLITGAPVTKASPVPGIYGAAPVFVTLTANNNLSKTYYTTNLSVPTTASQVYTGPIALNATTTIKYFSVDLIGNTEVYSTGTWTISPNDMAASVGINNGALVTNNASVTLALSAIDPAGVNTMQFSNDGVVYTAEEAYATIKTWTLSSGDGLKTVYVRYRDNSLPAPGFLYTPVTANITLDTTPPVTSVGPVPGTYSSPPIQVVLVANEAATIRYTTDGTVPGMTSTVYTGPISVAATTTIKYFAVDLAGNVEVVKTGTWTINTGIITASVSINNGALVTSSPTVTLSLLASVPTTTIALMSFSNDGINYTAEQAFAPSRSWLLSSGDGMKTVYVRYKDTSNPPVLYPPVSASITLDTIAPITTAGPIPGNYSATPVSITLTANEPATIYYTTNGTTPTLASPVYTGAISTAVTTTVKYFAVDTAGNTEVIKTGTWTIVAADLVASAQINDGAARINNSAVVLHLSAVDPLGVATMQFSNDGMTYTAEEAYTATKAWTLTAGDGIKTVYVRFRDYSLPTGYLYTPVTASVVLDTVAPVTTASPIAGIYGSPSTIVTLVSNETATIYFTVDGSTPTTASTVYTGPLMVSATTTIKYLTIDTAGNIAAVQTGTWTFPTTSDLTAASIIINTGEPATRNTAVTLHLLASDATCTSGVATMQFSNDGHIYTAEEPYATSRPWTITTGDGQKTVYVRYRDCALGGGMLYNPVTTSILLDTLAPVTTISPVTGSYQTPISVTLASNETATIYYTTDGSTPTTASTVYAGVFTISGIATVEYFAVDRAGNTEAAKSATLTTLYPVAFAAGANGEVTGTLNQVISHSASATAVTAAPAAHYHFVNWTGTNGFATSTANPLTVSNVTASQSITANFAIDTFSVTPSAGAGGSMSPGTGPNVDYNATTAFTITPDSGYHIVSVTGCNGSLSNTTYTTGAITGACTVTASFALPDGNFGNGGTVADALRALLIATGVMQPTTADLQHGDVAPLVGGKPAPDGKIDVGDVVVILRRAVNLVTW